MSDKSRHQLFELINDSNQVVLLCDAGNGIVCSSQFMKAALLELFNQIGNNEDKFKISKKDIINLVNISELD